MEIKIFNSELTYLGVVDDFESFTFVSKYNAVSYTHLTLPTIYSV